MNLDIVELYEAFLDVLRAFRGDFGLERHAVEWKVINEEDEFIRRDIIAQRNLPFHFRNLNFKREQAGIRELFPSHQFFGLLILQLHQSALLEECAQDDITHIFEDNMKGDLPLFRSVDVCHLVLVDPFIQLRPGQLLCVDTAVLHGHMTHLQVVTDAQISAKFGDILDWLVSKLHFTRLVPPSDILSKAIYIDFNPTMFVKNKFEIDILGVSISDAEARSRLAAYFVATV